MKKMKILVIEDDEDMRDIYMNIFNDIYDLELAKNGIDGVKKAFRGPPDIIVVDIKMPEMDGFQFCKTFREESEFAHIPIIVVSGFNNIEDRTRLFELGADDYLTKPFNRAELLARVHRKLQRADESLKNINPAIQNSKSFKDLRLDSKSRNIQIGKKKITLSFIEFKLLQLLVDHGDQLVTRADILEFVWEKQAVSPRLIDPHILAIRTKLSETPFTIQSVYGKGYIFKRVD
ncbi:MAG: response regulator transcription factor [Bacteriovorax sp.]|nr:response regulator transcription factor [Bacteriovorax sp.]